MPYNIRAVLAAAALLEPAPAWAGGSRVVALPQGIAMVPLGRELCGRRGPAERPWLYERHGELWLPAALVPELAALSRAGTVAYVESESHGGDVEQWSLVWRDGEAGRVEASSRAVEDALLALGVVPDGGRDRFDTLGLGRHRDVDDWLAAEAPAAAAPPPAAPPEPAAVPEQRRRWWRFFWG
ncbi:MAG: hypothetical protein AB1941_23065 [Gemmatimonadota bacterium]